MPRTFLVKRNGEGETIIHSDSSESRDLSISRLIHMQDATDTRINSEMDMRPVGRNPDEAKRVPMLDSSDGGDLNLYTEMERDPDGSPRTLHHNGHQHDTPRGDVHPDGSPRTLHHNGHQHDTPRCDVHRIDESKLADNLDNTNRNSPIKGRTESADTTPSTTSAKDEQESDKKAPVNETNIIGSLSEQNARKNGRSPESLNLSGSESTAVVLTKALKMLVSNDYDVVTPPRQPAKKPDQDPVEKKITLFRPYDLDNKSTSSDKSRLAITESPMLLRSNYSSTERESSWCIEKHSKSESVDSQLTAAMTLVTDKLSNSPKDNTTSDKASVFQNSSIGIFSKLSDSEKMKSENTKLKLSLKTSVPTYSIAVPVASQQACGSQKHPSLPAHMFKPLKSSTPKKPDTLPLETDGTAICSQWSHADTTKVMHNKVFDDSLAQSYTNRPPFVMPYQFSTNNDNSRFQMHHIAEICSDNRQLQKSGCDENQNNYATTMRKEPLAVHARYESAEGHRLPLKHSYKHQSYVAEPPDRGRPSRQDTAGEMGLKERIRSNSCPPIPSECNIPASIVGGSGIISCPSNKNSILSISNTGVTDAVKETWTSYPSVMTSKMTSDDNYKLALPSFSTFSNTPLHRRVYSEVEMQHMKSQDYRKSFEDVSVSKSGKHARSKSESMIKSATFVTDNSYAQQTERSRDTENHGLGGRHVSATAKAVSLNMSSTEPSRFVVPVSCYRNECVPHMEERNGGSSNKAQIAKCRTWHVPKLVSTANESLNTIRTQYPQNNLLNTGRKHDQVYSSQILPETPYYSGSMLPRQVTNVVSSQAGNASAFPDPKITLQYLDHQRKLIVNATNSKAGQSVGNDKYFNSEMNLYKDSHRSYQSHLPYPSITPPAINPDTRVFTKPVLNPSHMFASVPAPRFSKDPYVGQMPSKLEPSVLPGHVVSHAGPESSRSAQLLRPSLSDVRRPLGTSNLQNKSPAPQTEPKLPLAAVLLMMKSQSQGSSIEMINGGYGIKNPTYSAPKVQDFPESEKAPTKFVCKFCQKEFNLQRLLNRHLKCHSDTKRYLCTFCGKGFNDTFDLKRHTRIHTGVKPYKCPSCDKAFTQRCSLESHSRKVHGIELPFGYKQRRTKMYVCEDCGHSTADPDQHFQHLQQNHPFCPALTRCHDKRQFKFKTEPSDDDVSVGFEGQDQSLGDSLSSINALSDENSSSSILGHNANQSHTELVIEPAISDQDMNKTETANIMQRNNDQMIRAHIDIQHPYNSQTVPNPKRHVLVEVGTSSPKKMKLAQSPKKTNVRGSPMKNRLGGTRSDAGFVSPKFDIENITSQKTSVHGSKKLPLGCLSENSLGVQKNIETGNRIVNKEKVFERSNIPMVTKQPLGNTTQNTQW